MAIIWQKEYKQDLYEVRTAGRSVRLYSNGVFHSHYNPNHLLSNSIWDLLMLPALFQEKGSVERVLVMGVGGGTVIKLLNRYVQPQKIVGVEINPVHVQVAKKFFKITKKDAEIICADAIAWLKKYKGSPFDLIIDDMFGHADGEIQRAAPLDKAWFALLNKHLTGKGLVVINSTERSTLKESAYFQHRPTRNAFALAYSFQHPKCDNYIGAFFKSMRFKKDLLNNIKHFPQASVRNTLISMDYKMTQL